MVYPATKANLETDASNSLDANTEHPQRHNDTAATVNAHEGYGPVLSWATLVDSSAIANTVTETAFSVTHVFAAGELNIAQVLVKIKASGLFSTTGTPTLKLKPRIGTQSLGGVTKTTASGASNFIWTLESEFIVRSIGASGVILPHDYRYGLNTSIGGGISMSTDGATPLTIDLTGALTLDITATWGTASASNTLLLRGLSGQIFYPPPT